MKLIIFLTLVKLVVSEHYGHYKPKCHTEYKTVYETIYETHYKSKCYTEYDKKCHTEYDTTYITKYDKKCNTHYVPKCKHYYETIYKKKCTYKYDHKVFQCPLYFSNDFSNYIFVLSVWHTLWNDLSHKIRKEVWDKLQRTLWRTWIWIPQGLQMLQGTCQTLSWTSSKGKLVNNLKMISTLLFKYLLLTF